MYTVFESLEEKFFEVPDGTFLHPFLNPKDIMSGLPWDLLDGLSITAGQVNPGIKSEIMVHPYVTNVTVLLSGSIRIWMLEPFGSRKLYSHFLNISGYTGQKGFYSVAVLAQPGTFLQLDNSEGAEPARMLYLSSPSYVFEPGERTNDPPIYDDAITLGKDWEILEKQNWNPPIIHDPKKSFAARHQAIQRLAAKSRADISSD